MPKIQSDYSNTIIYKICCNDVNITDIYIGHTTNFTQRKHNHKINCCSENASNYNMNVYKFIRKNGGWDNWSMVQIENIFCNNKREALTKERLWIESLKAKLNCNNPITFQAEKIIQKHDWYEEKKDYILEKAKEHYEANKEQKIEYQKQYAVENKEKVKEYQSEYREKNKEKLSEQKKEYREEHKEAAANANKEWREANKDKIKTEKSQVIECECGNTYTFGNKHRHLQSKIHIAYQNKLEGKVEDEPQMVEEEKSKLEQDRIAHNKQKQKEYREKNAEKIKEMRKKHYEANKEHNKEQRKKYYDSHKEQIMEQNKVYIAENKEKVKQYKDNWYQKKKLVLNGECGNNNEEDQNNIIQNLDNSILSI